MGKTRKSTRAVITKQGNTKEKVINQRRDELFRSGWKNHKQLQPLVSRDEDNAFRFLVEWCEEYDEVLSKHRKRLSDPTPRMKRKIT